jgi:hypothetical protein
MKVIICILPLFFLMTASAPRFQFDTMVGLPAFPEATITNQLIEAHIYLPDEKEGYYRGSRFDWAGVVSYLSYKEHTYFGQWFEKYSPTLHDAIMGPVDAFDPIDYADAKPGESFVKVGIGSLTKPDDKPHHYAAAYEVVDAGKWTVKKKSSQVEFLHQLSWKNGGYVYTKVLRLEPGKPELTILHTLKNTGSRVLETNVYNHNFFVIDQQPTGPDFKITFPFNLSGELQGPAGTADLQGTRIVYNRILNKGETAMYAPLMGFSDSPKDNHVTIENTKTGAGVRISCDLPIVRLVYWSAPTTVCPEPFSKIRLAPGEEISWKIGYEFYEVPVRKE